MNMKKIGGILILTAVLSFSGVKVLAADATFSFYPSSGVVKDINEGFTVDVLINSGGYELNKARAVIKFDPTVIQLRTPMRNVFLFEEYPLEQSTIDNEHGIIMLTGYTPLDSEKPFYKTSNTGDVFARFEFSIVDPNVEQIVLSYEYSGIDGLFQSSLIKADVSAMNVLLAQPSPAVFTLNVEDVPETAIDMNTVGIVVGVLLILVGGFVRGSRVNLNRFSRGTIVLED